MDTAVTTGFQQEVNRHIDAVALINHIGYALDKIQVVNESIKCFCPIHKDARFRSLLVDTKKGTFKCTIKTCVGFGGGTLVDLAALALDLPPLDAAARVAHALKLPLEPDWFDRLADLGLEEAESARAAGDEAAAEKAIRNAISWHPSGIRARLALARLMSARGDKVDARDEYYQAAEAALDAGNHDDADKVLAEAAVLFPDDEDIMFVRIRSAEEQGRTDELAGLLESVARRREQSGRIGDNVGVLNQLITLRPDDAALHLRLAGAHESLHDINSAAGALEKAAELMNAAGRHAEAVQALEKVLRFDPNRLKLRSQIADHLLREGEYEHARTHIFESVNLMMERGDLVLAADTARKWLEVEPDSVEVYEALARIATEMADTPATVDALRRCADIHHAGGNTATAIEFLYRIKFQTPDDTDLRREIVRHLEESRQPERAALECLDLAEVLFGRDAHDDAVEVLRHAAELDASPSFRMLVADSLRNRGREADAAGMALAAADAAENIGETPMALDCLRQYLEANPDDLDAAARRVRLLWATDDADAALEATPGVAGGLNRGGRHDDARALLETAAERATARATGDAARALFQCAADAGAAGPAMAFYPATVQHLAEREDFAAAHAAVGRALAFSPDDRRLLGDAARFAGELGLAGERAGHLERLADGLERAGEAEQALAALQGAVEATPGDITLRRRMADLLARSGRRADAQSAWRDLLARQAQEQPDDVDALVALSGDYLATFPEDHDARRDLAERLIAAGRMPEAVRHLTQLLKAAEDAGDQQAELDVRQRLVNVDPGNPRLRMDLAQARERAGEVDGAMAILRELAAECAGRGQHAEAAEALRNAARLEPENADVAAELAAAEKAGGNEAAFEEALERLLRLGRPEMGVEWYRDRSRHSLEHKRVKEAREYTQHWLRFAPDDLDAQEQLAGIHVRQKRPQAAVELWMAVAEAARPSDPARAAANLRRIVEVDATATQARQLLWQVLLEAGREEEALEEMRQLADLLIDRRAYRDASTLLAHILEYRTRSVDTLRRLASLVHEHEGFAKAAPHFRKLLAIMRESPGEHDVGAEYEAVLRLEGADTDLRAEYAEFLVQAGRLPAAKAQMLQLAQAYRDEMSDPVRAIQFFGRATTLLPEPTDARVFEEVGTLHQSLGVPDFAAEAMREAARLHAANNDHAAAARVLERLMAMPVATPADRAHLGESLLLLGRRDEAAATLRTALEEGRESRTLTPRETREVCEHLLEVDPDDLPAMTALLDTLPKGDAAARANEMQARLALDGKTAARVALLRHAITIAPGNATLRKELLAGLRESGDEAALAAELEHACDHAITAGKTKDARAALDELLGLHLSPDDSVRAADLLERLGLTDKAIERLCQAAQQHAEAGSPAGAAQALTRAAAMSSTALPSSTVAGVLRRAGGAPELRPIVNQLLDSALRARNRTPALLMGTALLEFCTRDEGERMLRHVGEVAGQSFVATIGGAHADWLLDRDENERARQVTRFITEVAPDSPESWWLASQVYRKLDDKPESAKASMKAAQLFAQAGAVTEEETCYREALEEFPDDTGVLETLAFFYERERRIQDSIEMMRRLAGLAEREGRTANAIKWLRHAVELLPGDLAARDRLASLLEKEGRHDEAVTHLSEMADAHARAGSPAEAAAALERAHALQPENVDVITRLVDLTGEQGDMERLHRFSLALADTHARGGDLKLACVILNTLLEKEPGNTETLARLADYARDADDQRTEIRVLNQLGHKLAKGLDYAGAVDVFERLHALRPADADVLEMLTDCCVAGKMRPRAIAYAVKELELVRTGGGQAAIAKAAAKVLEIDPDNPSALALLGENVAASDPAKALEHLRRAAARFHVSGDNAGAAAALRRVVELDPDDAESWQSLAEHLTVLGEDGERRLALMSLAAALAGHGSDARVTDIVNTVLAEAPMDGPLHEKALAIWRKLASPQDVMAELVWLAPWYLRQGNFAAAEEAIEAGLATDPDDISLQESRIELLRQMGRAEERQFRLRELAGRLAANDDHRRAADLYAELLAHSPDLLDVRRELARLLRALGDDARANEESVATVRQMLRRDEGESARELADELLAANPADIGLRADVATVFLDEGNSEVAARWFAQAAALAAEGGDTARQMELLARATQARPNAVEPLRQLAEAAASAGRTAEAGEAFARLVNLFADQRRFNEAVGAAKRHVALAPHEAGPRRLLVDLYEKMGNKDDRLAELKDLGDLYVSGGDVDAAVGVFRELTLARPDDVQLLKRYIELFEQVGNEMELLDDYLRLADAYARQGKFVEATQTFEKLLTINRRSTAGRERYVEFLHTLGQKSRAVSEMVNLAEQYLASQRAPDALRVLTTAFTLSPEDPAIAELLATTAEKCGKTDEAVAHYDICARLVSDDDPAKAAHLLTSLLALAPQRADAREQLAGLHERTGDKAGRLMQLRRLAEHHLAAGDAAKAAEAQAEADALQADALGQLEERAADRNAPPWRRHDDLVMLGDMLGEAGDVDRAIDTYNQARAIRDDRPEVIQKVIDLTLMIAPENEAIADMLALAACHAKYGNARKAQETYEQVLALDPGNHQAKAALGLK